MDPPPDDDDRHDAYYDRQNRHRAEIWSAGLSWVVGLGIVMLVAYLFAGVPA